MAEVRRQGVNDLSIRPDNSISLGVFSTEEAARRFLTSVEAKGVKGAEQGPFTKDLRELVMLDPRARHRARRAPDRAAARLQRLAAARRPLPPSINGVRLQLS